jgi:hypothetical protein
MRAALAGLRANEARYFKNKYDLLDAAQAVTRTLLGVGVDPAGLPGRSRASTRPGPCSWMAYSRRAMPRGFTRYGG